MGDFVSDRLSETPLGDPCPMLFIEKKFMDPLRSPVLSIRTARLELRTASDAIMGQNRPNDNDYDGSTQPAYKSFS